MCQTNCHFRFCCSCGISYLCWAINCISAAPIAPLLLLPLSFCIVGWCKVNEQTQEGSSSGDLVGSKPNTTFLGMKNPGTQTNWTFWLVNLYRWSLYHLVMTNRKITIFKFGKPSIPLGHGYQRVLFGCSLRVHPFKDIDETRAVALPETLLLGVQTMGENNRWLI